MSKQNNVPTGPGLNYRQADNDDGYDVVRVHAARITGALWYATASGTRLHVEDDGLWLGPVPMPGEWVSIEEHKRALRSAGDFISDALNSGDGVYRP